MWLPRSESPSDEVAAGLHRLEKMTERSADLDRSLKPSQCQAVVTDVVARRAEDAVCLLYTSDAADE